MNLLECSTPTLVVIRKHDGSFARRHHVLTQVLNNIVCVQGKGTI